jgi:hypothetical protein
MRVSQSLILIPVAGQVLLTLAVLVLMGLARARSIRERRQKLDDLALAGDADWNEEALKYSNNFKNQFEVPVLFYVVCAFALMTRMVDLWFFALACLFVVSRAVHATLHIGPNRVAARAAAYIASVGTVALLWVLLLWRVSEAGF